MNKLAIIIPAYKSTFLRETLESIANQTDKCFTLYIGDDCSPHDLKSIVDEFQNRINIVYHRFEENLGGKDLVAHWNRCVDLTQDEPYIWLFSDDDVMSSTCVSDFYDTLKSENKSDVYRFNVSIIDNKGNVIKKVTYPREITAKDLYIQKIKGKLECFVVEYIFSRTSYERCGGFVNFDLAWGSDLASWVLFGEKKGILTMKSPGISWRSSGENISTDYNIATLKRKISALVECLKWGERQYPDDRVKKINKKGLISRLAAFGVTSGYFTGYRGILQYTFKPIERLSLSMRYLIHYSYKKLRHVF